MQLQAAKELTKWLDSALEKYAVVKDRPVCVLGIFGKSSSGSWKTAVVNQAFRRSIFIGPFPDNAPTAARIQAFYEPNSQTVILCLDSYLDYPLSGSGFLESEASTYSWLSEGEAEWGRRALVVAQLSTILLIMEPCPRFDLRWLRRLRNLNAMRGFGVRIPWRKMGESEEGGAPVRRRRRWRHLFVVRSKDRARLSFYSALLGAAEFVLTVARTTGGAVLVLSSAFAMVDSVLQSMFMVDCGAWVLGTILCGLSWLLRQPFRGYRITSTWPRVVYAMFGLQSIICLVSLAIYTTSRTVALHDGHYFHNDRYRVTRMQRFRACCGKDILGVQRHVKSSECADAEHCYVAFSCCRLDSTSCSQCRGTNGTCGLDPKKSVWEQDVGKENPFHQAHCKDAIPQHISGMCLTLLVFTLLIWPLNLGEAVLFRLGETSIRLAYQKRAPTGMSLGWILPRPPPAQLQEALRAARGRLVVASTPGRQHLDDDLEGADARPDFAPRSKWRLIELRKAIRDNTNWNKRWHELLIDGVDECETDYEEERPEKVDKKKAATEDASSRRVFRYSRTFRPAATPTHTPQHSLKLHAAPSPDSRPGTAKNPSDQTASA